MKFISIPLVFTALLMGAIAKTQPVASPEQVAEHDSPTNRSPPKVLTIAIKLPPNCTLYMTCSAGVNVGTCVAENYYCDEGGLEFNGRSPDVGCQLFCGCNTYCWD
ncbi:hypothetical protein B0H12DRAFT_1070223 [Mycena haematopus]|nr:hypothetical protein B0H12DRAFT_1070223 [Mycena haematopus]